MEFFEQRPKESYQAIHPREHIAKSNMAYSAAAPVNLHAQLLCKYIFALIGKQHQNAYSQKTRDLSTAYAAERSSG
ncbi:MAG: hypothetical protein ACYC46_00070 [Acidobacteriaceae bacterium]